MNILAEENKMILRASKFFGFCYADELLESEFFAKNFSVTAKENVLIFSFNWMRGLDYLRIKPQITIYCFYEIEDVYLRNKLMQVIKANSDIKKMKIEIDDFTAFIKQLKFTNKGFIIKL